MGGAVLKALSKLLPSKSALADIKHHRIHIYIKPFGKGLVISCVRPVVDKCPPTKKNFFKERTKALLQGKRP